MKRVKLLVFMFLIALFVLVACSEDSTGPGNDNQLKGTYSMSVFGAQQENNATLTDIWTDIVTLSFDGNVSGEILEISGVSVAETFTYSVDSSGKIIFDETGRGITTADGEIFTIISNGDNDSNFGQFVGMKKSEGLSNSVLTGDYMMTVFGANQLIEVPVADVWTDYVTLSFDGSGNCQILEISGVSSSESFSYSVNDDGILLFAETDTGIVNNAGDFFTVASESNSATGGVNYSQYVGIKKSENLSSSILIGTYIASIFGMKQENDSEVTDVWADIITMTFDGNGSGQITEISGNSTSYPFIYSVESDGTFIFEGTDYGVVSADGKKFTLVSGTTFGREDVDFIQYVGLKQ